MTGAAEKDREGAGRTSGNMAIAVHGAATAARTRAYTVVSEDLASGLGMTALVLPARGVPARMTTDVPVEAWRRMLTEPQRRYVAEFRRQPEPDDAFASDLAELGLAPAISVRPLELPAAILWAVAQDEEKLNIDAFEKAMESRQVGLPVPAVFGQTPGRLDAALAFAEHVAYAPIMPVENSPVRGEALVSASPASVRPRAERQRSSYRKAACCSP